MNHYQQAIDHLRQLYLAGEVLQFAFSGGKDSHAIVNLGLDAARQLAEAGHQLPPIYVLHGNTLIEQPIVQAHAMERLEQIKAYAERHGLDVRVRVARPNLMSTFQVKVVSGRALPTFNSKGSRDCTIDYKIRPMRAVMSAARAELRREGRPAPIVVLGTRIDESASRAARMKDRGDTGEVVERDGERTLALIANWSTDDVWMYLASCGTAGVYPAFTSDFDETVELYREASGECPVIASEQIEQQRSACGSRTGCWGCAVAGSEDRSMTNFLSHARHRHLQGLAALRDWFVATEGDYSLRRWVGRRPDPTTGYVPIAPNCYSAETTEMLLHVMLTLDKREQDRAYRFRALVEAGLVESDPGVAELRAEGASEERIQTYIRRMSRPTFQIISLEMLLTIDAIWSLDALHSPFHALHLWREVFVRGNERDVPVASRFPSRPRPAIRWRKVGYDVYTRDSGFFDPLLRFQTEGCQAYRAVERVGERIRPDSTVCDEPLGEAIEVFDGRYSDALTVDREGAELLFGLELENLLEKHDSFDPSYQSRTSGFRYYLLTGPIAMAAGNTARAEQMLHRARLWERWGLAGAVSPEQALVDTISEAEHKALKASLLAEQQQKEQAAQTHAEHKQQRVERWLPELAGDAAAVLDARRRMRSCLPAKLARLVAYDSFAAWAKAHEIDNPTDDGLPIELRRRRLRRFVREWQEWAYDGPHAEYLAPLALRLERQVYDRALYLMDNPSDLVNAIQWGFGVQFKRHNQTVQLDEYKEALNRLAELEATHRREIAPARYQMELLAA